MKTIVVSIIIPTFGRARSLEGALSSALNQTYENIEVVVVDDNNPDTPDRAETEKIICQLNDKRIKYLKQPRNSGGGAARNAGINQSSGEFLCFLDDDDTFHPEKVSEQIRHIKQNELDISLCYLNAKIGDGLGKGLTIRPVAGNIKEFVMYGNVMNGMLMLRRDLCLQAGGFQDVPRFQDHILMFDLYSLNPKIGVIDKELYFARTHFDMRVSNSAKSRIAYNARHSYEDKHVDLLSEAERKILADRQRLSLLICDLNEASLYHKFLIALRFMFCDRNIPGVIRNVSSLLKYTLSKIRLLQKIRYFYKSLLG